jgi:hypothetical protein
MLRTELLASASPASLLKSKALAAVRAVGGMRVSACLLKPASVRDSVCYAREATVSGAILRVPDSWCFVICTGESSGSITACNFLKDSSLCSRVGFLRAITT